jgi:TonB family protein
MLRRYPKRLKKTPTVIKGQPDQPDSPTNFEDLEEQPISRANHSGGILNHALSLIIGSMLVIIFATHYLKTDLYGLINLIYAETKTVLNHLQENIPLSWLMEIKDLKRNDQDDQENVSRTTTNVTSSARPKVELSKVVPSDQPAQKPQTGSKLKEVENKSYPESIGNRDTIRIIQNEIQTRILREWRRPSSIQPELEVTLSLTLDQSGDLSAVTILKSSGNSRYDQSAKEAISKASPFKEVAQIGAGTFEQNFRQITIKFRAVEGSSPLALERNENAQLNSKTLKEPVLKAKSTEFNYVYWHHVFDEEFSGSQWDLGNPIRWALVPDDTQYRTTGTDVPAVSKASTRQKLLARQAFQAWNDAAPRDLFVEVEELSQAEVIVAFPNDWDARVRVYGLESSAAGIWQASWTKPNLLRTKGSIELKRDLSDAKFVHATLHEIGNLLGLGDVIFASFPTTQIFQLKDQRYKRPQPMDVQWLKILYQSEFGNLDPPFVEAEIQGALKKQYRDSPIKYPETCTKLKNQTIEFEVKFNNDGIVSDVAIIRAGLCSAFTQSVAQNLYKTPQIPLFAQLTGDDLISALKSFRIIFHLNKD